MALSNSSKGFLGVLVVVAVLAGGALFWLGRGGATSVPEGETVAIEIPEGTSVAGVAELLAEQGVIRSALAFEVNARLDDRALQIRAGTHTLTSGMSADEILAVLSAPPPEADSFRVTIPEGLDVDETLTRIAEAEGSPFTVEQLRSALTAVPLPSWVPVDTLPEGAEPFEGLLFPNTYDFVVASDPQTVLARLLEETEAVMAGVTPPEGRSLYDVLITASLIEREARLREEQPVISSVITNRLAEGMRLQIDATVLYALGEHKDRVLNADLEVQSPWNTYVNAGLPPTPISGAGEAAIQAAANPAKTDFLYYVVVDPETGRHEFNRTLEEHNAAKARAG
jgi:UPF0755 protein